MKCDCNAESHGVQGCSTIVEGLPTCIDCVEGGCELSPPLHRRSNHEIAIWHSDPMDGHKCKKIASAPFMAEGRDWWLGELEEPILGYPLETHCLHMITPAKSVVFGVMHGDTQALAIFAAVLQGSPINEQWQSSMMVAYRKAVN